MAGGLGQQNLYDNGFLAVRAIVPGDGSGVIFATVGGIELLHADGGTSPIRTSAVDQLWVDPPEMFFRPFNSTRLFISPIDGGPSRSLQQSNYMKVAIGPTNVFIGNTTDAGDLAQVSRASGVVTTLTNSATVEGIVVDGTNLFYTDRATSLRGGAIVRVSPIRP